MSTKNIALKAIATFGAGAAASAALIWSWPGNWDFRSLWAIGLVGSGATALAGAGADLVRQAQLASAGKTTSQAAADALLERLRSDATISVDQVLSIGETIARLESGAIAPTTHQITNGAVPTPPAPLEISALPPKP